MPIPLKPVRYQYNNEEVYPDSVIDISFLSQQISGNKIVTAGNNDAALLFSLWENGESLGKDTIKLTDSYGSEELSRLKRMGFITVSGNKIHFTDRGKKVVVTMTLAESSRFEKNKQSKAYTEILAGMNKRGKPGYRIPSFASDNSNTLHS